MIVAHTRDNAMTSRGHQEAEDAWMSVAFGRADAHVWRHQLHAGYYNNEGQPGNLEWFLGYPEARSVLPVISRNGAAPAISKPRVPV